MMGNELEKKGSTFFLVGGTKGSLSIRAILQKSVQKCDFRVASMFMQFKSLFCPLEINFFCLIHPRGLTSKIYINRAIGKPRIILEIQAEVLYYLHYPMSPGKEVLV